MIFMDADFDIVDVYHYRRKPELVVSQTLPSHVMHHGVRTCVETLCLGTVTLSGRSRGGATGKYVFNNQRTLFYTYCSLKSWIHHWPCSVRNYTDFIQGNLKQI